MPINGIETAYKDRYTFAPLSQRAVPIQWYTLPLRFIPAAPHFVAAVGPPSHHADALFPIVRAGIGTAQLLAPARRARSSIAARVSGAHS